MARINSLVMEDMTITDAQSQTHAYQLKGIQTMTVMRVLEIAPNFVALSKCAVMVGWKRMAANGKIRASQRKGIWAGTVQDAKECAQEPVAQLKCGATKD